MDQLWNRARRLHRIVQGFLRDDLAAHPCENCGQFIETDWLPWEPWLCTKCAHQFPDLVTKTKGAPPIVVVGPGAQGFPIAVQIPAHKKR